MSDENEALRQAAAATADLVMENADLRRQLEEAHQTVHRESREALRRAIERAEAAERQLDEARKPSDYWRQVAEATELTKQGLEQDIEMIKGERADFAMENADLKLTLEELKEALECEVATWRRHWKDRDQTALAVERQLALCQKQYAIAEGQATSRAQMVEEFRAELAKMYEAFKMLSRQLGETERQLEEAVLREQRKPRATLQGVAADLQWAQGRVGSRSSVTGDEPQEADGKQWISGHVGGRSPTTGNGDEP